MAVSATKGGRFSRQNAGQVVGPSSYVNGTGQAVYASSFGLRAFLALIPSMSVSGTYYARWQPKSATPNTVGYLRWYVTATNAEVGNGVSLAAETINIMTFGG